MDAGGAFYDDLETRDPEEREAALMAALPKQIAHAKKNARAYARLLDGVEPADVTSRAALAQLPVTRKSDLIELQKEAPPLGGFNGAPIEALARVFASPGPIYEPQGKGKDVWGAARSLFAAGIRPGEIVHNSFSYHLTPAGFMLEGGAHALGCPVIPGGVGNTEQQVVAIAHIGPAAYTGTPSFLKILLDKAAEMGADIGSMSKALVGAEPFPPPLRQELKDKGVTALQTLATADLGVIAYESHPVEGMILNENIILEIVRPGTGDPVPEGEVGEIVVTLFNTGYPLVRFATGDMTATLPGRSACGRTNQRIKGWMGRADQTTKVRGMFVHPGQIADVLKRHPEVEKARLVVSTADNLDVATLRCEAKDRGSDLATALAESFRAVCKVRCEAEIVPPASLPNDGKVIEDARPME